MFNAREYDNAKPDGFAVLEIVDSLEREGARRRFVPLKKSHLNGSIVGPLCEMHLCQTFGYTAEQCGETIEAAYRFPLPGDAAVIGVRVHFGEVIIVAELKERQAAEAEYEEAKALGKQAALTTRESPDVFTIQVAGLQPDQDVLVETSYVQLSRREGASWSLRVPLTTAPRYVREDERESRHAAGQPLALMRDPGHRFSMNLTLEKAAAAKCSTHAIAAIEDGDELKVKLNDGEVVPDRDLVLTWQCRQYPSNPALHVLTHREGQNVYFLAMATPPAAQQGAVVPREMVLLIDRSGSMNGSKWDAADAAARGLLASLDANDTFVLGLFHSTTHWLTARPISATDANLKSARLFLDRKDSGGTEFGVALEQAITLPRCSDTRARSIVVITDAEVSDAGRILRLVHEEAKRPGPRRISIICIDSAPNSHLVNEIVDAGCGSARFLTSDPDHEDLSSALADLAQEFASPLVAGISLQVNRSGLEVFGRSVAANGVGGSVAMGDLPAGRTIWISGRYQANAETDAIFRLKTTEGIETAACTAERSNTRHEALKPLFGAKRLNALEYLMTAGYTGSVLRDRMREIGFEGDAVDAKVVRPSLYTENSMQAGREALRNLLVKESLEYGIACSETAFVAARKEAGKQVEESVVVANALPSGWDDNCLYQMSTTPASAQYSCRVAGGVPSMRSRTFEYKMGKGAQSTMREAMARYACRDSGVDMDCDSGDSIPFLRRLLNKLQGKPNQAIYAETAIQGVSLYRGIPITKNAELVLFDSSRDCNPNIHHVGQKVYNEIQVTILSGNMKLDAVDRGLRLKLYIGDPDIPALDLSLSDLLSYNGAMPASICRNTEDAVRLVLQDPNGAWAHHAPMIEIWLGW